MECTFFNVSLIIYIVMIGIATIVSLVEVEKLLEFKDINCVGHILLYTVTLPANILVSLLRVLFAALTCKFR